MNKHIHALCEAFLDPDDDFIFGDNDLDTQDNTMIDDYLDILYNEDLKRRTTWIDHHKGSTNISLQYADSNSCYVLYENSENPYDMFQFEITSRNSIEAFNGLLQILKAKGIKYVFNVINIRIGEYDKLKKDEVYNNVIDFQGIQFPGGNVYGCHPKNLYINKSDFENNPAYKNAEFLEKYEPASYTYSIHYEYHFVNSWIDETINATDIEGILLQNCWNIKDFSFIKHINSDFKLTIYRGSAAPACGNLYGLPEGNYGIYITYGTPLRYNSSDIKDIFADMPVQSLLYCPKNVRCISLGLDSSSKYILPHISLEGLTLEMIPSFEFYARGFSGQNSKETIQLGPYTIKVRTRTWKPTKEQLKGIIATQDWFLDCYVDKPNKEYVKSMYAPDEQLKITKKLNAKEQQKQDAIEDKKLYVKKCISVLKNFTDFYDFQDAHYYNLNVDGENKLHYTRVFVGSRYSNARKYTTDIESFVDYIIKHPDYLLDSTKTKTLYDLIIKPIKAKRKRINAMRAQEAREQRKAERLAAKNASSLQYQNQEPTNEPEEEPEDFNIEETPVETPKSTKERTVKTSKESKAKEKETPKSNIQIEDYSDKAIAIFGDTWNIKDKLKEVGCKYNPSLKRGDKKQPGWIVGKKKREEIEKIINTL